MIKPQAASDLYPMTKPGATPFWLYILAHKLGASTYADINTAHRIRYYNIPVEKQLEYAIGNLQLEKKQ